MKQYKKYWLIGKTNYVIIKFSEGNWLYLKFQKFPDYWILCISRFCICNNAVKLHEDWAKK